MATSTSARASIRAGPLQAAWPTEIEVDWGPDDILDWPDGLRWPITVGVPFRRGWLGPADPITVADDTGPVSCQIDRIARWPDDGSVRWAHVSFIAERPRRYELQPAPPPPPGPAILTVAPSGTITAETEHLRLVFDPDEGCFRSLRVMTPQGWRLLVPDGRDAFYLLDGNGHRHVLRADAVEVDPASGASPSLHAVIRVEGEYVPPPGVAPLAAAIVYFHVYAGVPLVRISHKLIITSDYAAVLQEIGFDVGLELGDDATAVFNDRHDDVAAAAPLPVPATGEVVMHQHDHPHFAHTETTMALDGQTHHRAAGDWFDVNDGEGGLAIQVPAFAEQYAKAMVARRTGGLAHAVVELWSGRNPNGSPGSRALDYSTQAVVQSHLGHDWIDPTIAVTLRQSQPAGSAKTHELWLHPHPGGLPDPERTFGGTRHEIHARPSPKWVCASGAIGPVAPHGGAPMDAGIDDYFDRKMFANQQVFPPSGYLFHGMYPYVATKWHIRAGPSGADRWYPGDDPTHPAVFRLGWYPDYNLRRTVWVLWARGGARRYYHFARRHTRTAADLLFSSWDADLKPRGWAVIADRHSPIPWGAWDATPPPASGPRRPSNPLSQGSAVLAHAGSSDVVQFVYAYHFAGDLHARDMVRWWQAEVLRELNPANPSAVKAALAGAARPDSLLRMLASAYELDMEPRILELGRIVAEHVAGAPAGRDPWHIAARWRSEKTLDIVLACWLWYVATGDPVAREVLLRYARFGLRHRFPTDWYHRRNGALLAAGALAAVEEGDEAWTAGLRAIAVHYAREGTYLEREGWTLAHFDQSTTDDWGTGTMQVQAAYGLGLPVAAAALDRLGSRIAPPAATKHSAATRSYLLFGHTGGQPTELELALTLDSADCFDPVLRDLGGNRHPVDLTGMERHRVTAPEPRESPWYQMFGTHVAATVTVPADTPTGTYRLDLGDSAAFRVLRTSASAVVQEAPDGICLSRGEMLYFDVPGVVDLELFAHRAVEVVDANDRVVPPAGPPAAGISTYATAGAAVGLWGVRTAPNAARAGQGRAETFVRVVAGGAGEFALDRRSRHISAGPNAVPAALRQAGAAGAASAGEADGLFLFRRVVELPPAAGFPLLEGTVELWVRPRWSSTDFALADDVELTLFEAVNDRDESLSLSYRLKPDVASTGRYDLSAVVFDVFPVDNGNSGRSRRRLKFPARAWLEAGRTHHLAATWRIDGGTSEAQVFVDGRRKSYFTIEQGVAQTGIAATAQHQSAPQPGAAPPSADTVVRIGSARGRRAGYDNGEAYLGARVSTTIRYHDDFGPPSPPVTPEPSDYLVANLDGLPVALSVGSPVPVDRLGGGPATAAIANSP